MATYLIREQARKQDKYATYLIREQARKQDHG